MQLRNGEDNPSLHELRDLPHEMAGLTLINNVIENGGNLGVNFIFRYNKRYHLITNTFCSLGNKRATQKG
jgi:hypothetical protein